MPSAAPPEIGTKLRRARIERALSIEETAWRTRIRPDLLRALEHGEFEQIGHNSFVKTHLNSYARFLGVDPDEVAINDEGPSAIAELERQTKESRKPPRAKWLIAAAVSGALLLAAGVAGVLGGAGERSAGDVTGPITLDAPGDASKNAVPVSEARVSLAVAATKVTSVSVIADGERIFDGDLTPDDHRTFRGRKEVEIIIADASAVRIGFNGESLGVAGDRGVAYRARFGPNGRIDK